MKKLLTFLPFKLVGSWYGTTLMTTMFIDSFKTLQTGAKSLNTMTLLTLTYANY